MPVRLPFSVYPRFPRSCPSLHAYRTRPSNFSPLFLNFVPPLHKVSSPTLPFPTPTPRRYEIYLWIFMTAIVHHYRALDRKLGATGRCIEPSPFRLPSRIRCTRLCASHDCFRKIEISINEKETVFQLKGIFFLVKKSRRPSSILLYHHPRIRTRRYI